MHPPSFSEKHGNVLSGRTAPYERGYLSRRLRNARYWGGVCIAVVASPVKAEDPADIPAGLPVLALMRRRRRLVCCQSMEPATWRTLLAKGVLVRSRPDFLTTC
jgi:hypothetical protein